MAQVIAIVGPTGVGKSEVAQLVAERISGEIISADSMQVYRRLDVGTGKVPRSDQRVTHHCLDIADIDQPYSASDYQRDARAAIEQCFARSVIPVVCGGTGLYIRSALDDMDFVEGAPAANAIRNVLEAQLAEHGPEWMWRRLLEVDPACESILHPNNAVRVVRALEMAERGTLYSEQVAGFRTHRDRYDTLYIGLTMDRRMLYRTIEDRVDSMLDGGWLDEAASLAEAGYGEDLVSKGPIGYPELVDVARGVITMAEAVESIKTGTRRYAKRQLTWFRADDRVHWIDRTDLSGEAVADQILQLIAESA